MHNDDGHTNIRCFYRKRAFNIGKPLHNAFLCLLVKNQKPGGKGSYSIFDARTITLSTPPKPCGVNRITFVVSFGGRCRKFVR
jgi:hypothetical protein